MKSISVVLAVFLLLGFGIAFAQENTGSTEQTKSSARMMRATGQRAVANQNIQPLTANQNASSSTTVAGVRKSADCDGSGRGYGDGSKLQPKDGTGFGAKAQKRQRRNARLGKGQGKGAQNGNPQRARRQLRDGSCGTANNSAPDNVSTESK